MTEAGEAGLKPSYTTHCTIEEPETTKPPTSWQQTPGCSSMQVTWTAIHIPGVSRYHRTTCLGACGGAVQGRGRRAYKGRKGEAERRGDPCHADSTTEVCSG